MLAKPVAGGAAAHLEARLIGVEMAAWDQDELLGLMRLLIGREGEVGLAPPPGRERPLVQRDEDLAGIR